MLVFNLSFGICLYVLTFLTSFHLFSPSDLPALEKPLIHDGYSLESIPSQQDIKSKNILAQISGRRQRTQFPAPSLAGGQDWINTSQPIRLADLKGKIVLLDFWTYCCINCMNMLPVLKQLEEKYPNELVVIGVHSPKFAAERENENLEQAVRRYEIHHPVVNDAKYAIWRRYSVDTWPSFRLIDPEGRLVASDKGEIPFKKLDNAVAALIRKHRRSKTLDETPVKFFQPSEKKEPTPLLYPGKVLADPENKRLFIADSSHHRLIVSSIDGKVTDVIGTGEIGAENGPYAKATFHDPQGMALLGKYLYVADHQNHLIRQIDLSRKEVKTIAGTGRQAQYGSRGGRARSSALNSPWDLTILGRNLFVAMAGPHQIWRYSFQKRTITPYSGSGIEDILDGPLSQAAHAQPSGIVNDGNMLFLVDSEGSAVRTISLIPNGSVTTLVGPEGFPNAQSLFQYGDRDGFGPAARLQHPVGLTLHGGLLYITDTYNHKIKVLDPRRRFIKTLLGDGKPGKDNIPPKFHEPTGISAAGNKLYIADTNNHRIQVANLNTLEVETLNLQGLKPPQPPAPKALSLPNPVRLTVPEQRLRPQEELKIDVTINLPEGFSFNQAAPVSFRIESTKEESLVEKSALDSFHELDSSEQPFTITVPLKKREGSDRLRVALVYYSCRKGAEAICRIQSAVWTIPLSVSKTGNKELIELNYQPKLKKTFFPGKIPINSR